MARYSFTVGLFHPQLHAGLSRRLRPVTVAVRKSQVKERQRNGPFSGSVRRIDHIRPVSVFALRAELTKE